MDFNKISEYYDTMYVSESSCKEEADSILYLAKKHGQAKLLKVCPGSFE